MSHENDDEAQSLWELCKALFPEAAARIEAGECDVSVATHGQLEQDVSGEEEHDDDQEAASQEADSTRPGVHAAEEPFDLAAHNLKQRAYAQQLHDDGFSCLEMVSPWGEVVVIPLFAG